MTRSIEDINERIVEGKAIVLTAQEVGELVENDDDILLEDVDVVTTATRAVMSGTYAVLSFRVDAPFSFTRADKVFLNEVPAYVGPCPNERLGVLDVMVFGTTHG
ncbi:MAG: homocysteine biosynthesis protein, partial [Euryarchaeota archaeon]|nr:homocysteine biosynthesis protein [Euryarchaeota archaeon]